MADVKVHGFWFSPFVFRVVWTLKIKGIPYEYIEEDPANKTPQLLQYNPVHKKVPVFVHDGKPLCESMIIVEYIDELWPQTPLVPSDPYEKAVARFWVRYVDDMMSAVLPQFFGRKFGSEDQEKVIKDIWERFGVIEDQYLGDHKKFFGGDTLNIVDIAFGSSMRTLVGLQDALEVKILVAEKFPRLHAWFNNFMDIPVINNNPEHEKLVAAIKVFREKLSASSRE